MRLNGLMAAVLLCGAAWLTGCGANAQKIGGECTENAQCENQQLSCLTAFKGGYCGSSGCTKDADCAAGSRCVTQDNVNYCFLECTDKAECNENRTVDNESNCSANITRVEAGTWKACVPPSSGV